MTLYLHRNNDIEEGGHLGIRTRSSFHFLSFFFLTFDTVIVHIMSAQHPKNEQEAFSVEEKGLKHQLSQTVDAQERIVNELKKQSDKKEDLQREQDHLNSLKKELSILQKSDQ
ncbi:hypothetical protein BDF20DRAFT_842713 [Mycotypha africana]|uniref:uncharacterized protein n=1 Tax=Mycotypha africana TaxID=64632 RepID=UPI002301A229|nr:uncharacterized protein BDF20DRAFT_842713 [Mycotypha africana]KAI8991111.1 hypothetical protein BDF20DRAFT_842713 [Mycotypha africana]